MLLRNASCRRFSITSCFNVPSAGDGRGRAAGREPAEWWALWNEGLATYELETESNADRAMFWIPRDMEAQMQPKLAEAARLMLDDIVVTRVTAVVSGRLEPVRACPRAAATTQGYLLAKQADRGDVAALARMPPTRSPRSARVLGVAGRELRNALVEERPASNDLTRTGP